MLTKTYMRLRRKLCHLAKDGRGVSLWTNLMNTREIVPVLRAGFDPGVPPHMNIEITTDCNYKCPFCPQSSNHRPARYITPDAFHHFVAQLVSIDFGGLIVLSVNNEPFLHPHLISFCREISEKLPRARTAVTSNGSLITKEHLRQLSEIPNPPLLTIDDYTPDRRVKKQLLEWSSDPALAKLKMDIIERSWDETISNRAGNQPGCKTVLSDYSDVVCTWPFLGMFINSELKVFLCCSDYRHEVIVGDLAVQGVMEIWNGPVLAALREKMLTSQRRSIPLCSRCDAEWTCLPDHCAGR